MDAAMKKNLRLLCEKYNHKLEYHNHGIKICIKNTSLNIYENHQNFNIEFISPNHIQKINILENSVYDAIIEYFYWHESPELKLDRNVLISLDVWENEEDQYILKEFNTFKKEVSIDKTVYKSFGGNRILTEYYKGVLILRDDLAYYKSNVIYL